MANYYPNIVYFTLLKRLPGCKVGDPVSIINADGRECLTINGIELPIDYAEHFPDWFKPIDEKAHIELCESNVIVFIMEKYGMTLDEAKEKFKIFSKQKD